MTSGVGETTFSDEVKRLLDDQHSALLGPWHAAARDQLRAATFPSKHSEAWRYTDLARAFAAPGTHELGVTNVKSSDDPSANVRVSTSTPARDRVPKHGGVLVERISALGTAAASSQLSAWLGDARIARDFPAMLAAALAPDVVLINVAAGAKTTIVLDDESLAVGVEHPHRGTIRCARVCVRVEAGAEVHLYQTQSPGAETCRLVQVSAARDAKVVHGVVLLQTEQSPSLFSALVDVDENASYRQIQFALGPRFFRHSTSVELRGTNARTSLDGVFLAPSNSHVDNQLSVRHLVPNTSSSMNYRGVVDAGGKAVFNGGVYVAKGASKTDAEQSCHSLLLARGAEVAAKPQLEIYCDDVKCAHGATVGQMDEDALFYLRSRGIPQSSAKALLVRAFLHRMLPDDVAPFFRALTTAQLDTSLDALFLESARHEEET